MLTQQQMADAFVKQNSEQLLRVKNSLLEAAHVLLDEVGPHALSPMEIERTKALCEQEDLGRLLSVPRARASAFVRARCSAALWAWVDGVSFFFDAVGANWPYFTMEKREISLQWATEHAQAVKGVRHAALA